MNCCDRIMILFLAFSFVQFISRWESDSEIARAPWQIYVMGDSKKTPMKSSSPIVFSKRATAYGTPTSKITDSYIYSTDRQEIFIILNANVTGPPMSFHRIQITVEDIPIREISLITSVTGMSHASIYMSMIHMPSKQIKVRYLFDDIWSMEGKGRAHVHMAIRSGYSSLWDVKWSDVYKAYNNI